MNEEWSKVAKHYSEIFEDHWRTLYWVSSSILLTAWPAYIFSSGEDFDHKFSFLLMATFAIIVAWVAHQSPANMNRRGLCNYRWNKPTAIENITLAIATLSTAYIFGRFFFDFIANVISSY